MPVGVDVPDTEARLGGVRCVGGASGEVGFDIARAWVGDGSDDGVPVLGLGTAGFASCLEIPERRGGGIVGLGLVFGFSSCVSRADTKDDGDDGVS